MKIKQICCIYAIVNITNGKRYVGSTIDFENRKIEHLRLLQINCHHSLYLQRAFNKYGIDNFEFNIIEFLDSNIKYEALINKEQYYINKKSEYNISKIAGRPPLNQKATLITNLRGMEIGKYENRILAFKENNLRLTTKKFPFQHKGFLFFDATATKEEIAKFVEWNKNKYKGKEKTVYQYDANGNFLKEWISVKSIVEFYSNSKKRCSISFAIKNHRLCYGYYFSYTKTFQKHINKKHKTKSVCVYDKNNVCIDIFNSIAECARQMNDQKGNIIQVCKGKKKHSKGFIYKYLENNFSC
jgi:group I intron endonuclease